MSDHAGVAPLEGSNVTRENTYTCDLCHGDAVAYVDGIYLCEAHAEWGPEALVDAARGTLGSVRGALALPVVRRLEAYLEGC